MNRNLTKLTLFLIASLFAGFPAFAQKSIQKVTFETILVEASNSGEGMDASLKPYAGTLERLFKFDTYRRIKNSSFRIDVPGSNGGAIGNGSSLFIDVNAASGRALLTDLEWRRGDQRLVHTRLKIRRGTAAVLGGPRSASGEGNYLLIIVWP